jgi:hypothetical protein
MSLAGKISDLTGGKLGIGASLNTAFKGNQKF